MTLVPCVVSLDNIGLTETTALHYFISDTHFTHTGAALHHSARPFANIDEHDRCLIDSWNSVVTPDDAVWHLGDFGSDRPDPKAMRRIFSQL